MIYITDSTEQHKAQDETPDETPDEKGKSIVDRVTPSQPNSLQELSSSMHGFLNRFKHKCFLFVLTQSNGFQKMKAIEYGTKLKTKDLEIMRVTEPYIDLRTGSHIYFTTLNSPHTVKVCEKSFAYYDNLDSLRGKSTMGKGADIIPDLFAKAQQYNMVQEINNSNRTTKRDVMLIILCLVAGAAIGNWIDALTGADGGDDIEITGDYNENVNPSPEPNPDGNGNGNGDPIVIP